MASLGKRSRERRVLSLPLAMELASDYGKQNTVFCAQRVGSLCLWFGLCEPESSQSIRHQRHELDSDGGTAVYVLAIYTKAILGSADRR